MTGLECHISGKMPILDSRSSPKRAPLWRGSDHRAIPSRPNLFKRVDDLAAGGEPDAIVLLEVRNGLLQIRRAPRFAHQKRVQWYSHDAGGFLAVRIKRVEFIPTGLHDHQG